MSIVDPADDRHESKLIIKDRKHKFRRYKSVFTGSNLLDVLSTSNHPYSSDPSEDVALPVRELDVDIDTAFPFLPSHHRDGRIGTARWVDS